MSTVNSLNLDPLHLIALDPEMNRCGQILDILNLYVLPDEQYPSQRHKDDHIIICIRQHSLL